MMIKPKEVLDFWFGTDPDKPSQNSAMWWKKDPELDTEIKNRFLESLQKAVTGELDTWKNVPSGTLAWIILLDQFSRNIFRDQTEAFAQDDLAQEACLEGMAQGQDTALSHVQRVFFYMPLMHSEKWEHHEISLQLFRKLADTCPPQYKKILEGNYNYAVSHAKIIKRFGRYPHRNKILGRVSTPEEIEFLGQPGSSF